MLCLLSSLLTCCLILASPSAALALDLSAPGRNDGQWSGDKPRVSIQLDQASPLVTATSGYHAKVSLINESDQETPAGSLQVLTNSFYTFLSRTDIQQWAEADEPIAVPNLLGEVDIAPIPAGGKTSATIDVPADQEQLKAMFSWGPKPLLFRYQTDKGHNVDLHSFLTRSSEGLQTAQTPPLQMTVVLPLSSRNWQVDQDSINTLLTHGVEDEDGAAGHGSQQGDKRADDGKDGKNKTNQDKTSQGNSGPDKNNTDKNNNDKAQQDKDAENKNPAAKGQKQADSGSEPATGKASPGGKDSESSLWPLTLDCKTKSERARLKAISDNSKLQVVADPLYQQALSVPAKTSGTMQPGAFDITGYAALGQEANYQAAGISPSLWSAQAAEQAEHKALGVQTATMPAYAWQGRGEWTLKALETARRQGYSRVIADSGVEYNKSTTVHTGKYTVPTSAGDVTILSAQETLTGLAQGKPSSKQALAETGEAGQLARFMAQSAYYQMEQPYSTRNVLVCLKAGASAQQINALMGAVGGASWLSLSSLDDLFSTEAYKSGDEALKSLPQESKLTDADASTLTHGLTQLAASRKDIERFTDSILATPHSQEDRSQAQPDRLSKNPSPKVDEGDAQSLAKQEAKVNRTKDGREWTSRLLRCQSRLALLALGKEGDVEERMGKASSAIGQGLLQGVSITPTENINVISETAKMPVTISNKLPYPVSVRVSSITDSMEIATSRFADVNIPARGEVQTTFNIRVATSGSTQARLTLQDRKGNNFSSPQTTSITSSLQISDKSGFVLIILALILGALGLWRQFHRQKDPDE
ncbi:hypothetical protein CRD60_07775 [Bifidobacterium aemilianum]|uniref:Secreted protein n=1 Tax=Bifidobacterium aemilianum TaxID=2493120 RepID=A0A366K6A0_9BIFI|nr:DUF6049 family protein [Bifidobacterium aemilianum]RBP97270.1 hypothetical protein CRD60_07775 [Bifidobacterium aemilianum]